MAGTVIVSCKKGGGEEDIDGVGARSQPLIQPLTNPSANTYTINTDGTTISLYSSGFSFLIRAEEITFKGFNCSLDRGEKFFFEKECNLQLNGSSTFNMFNRGVFGGRHITLSGNGSIKFIESYINETSYNNMFSAAEGFTITSSGKKEEEKGRESIEWKVRRN